MAFVCIVCSSSHHDCVNTRWKESSSSEMRDLRNGPLSEDTKMNCMDFTIDILFIAKTV